ncbi:MAG TPA: hypothetical protein VF230_17770 [Acidimicrobiales bacterium]
MGGSVTAVVVVVFVALTLNVYRIEWNRRRSGYYEQFTADSPIGLAPDEKVVHYWEAERYFGPLVPGSDRSVADWAAVFGRNLVPGRHWLVTQPFIRHRGAPMQVRLTDQQRLVVTVASGYDDGRPRVRPQGSEARDGFEFEMAAGPPFRARVETFEQAFPGRKPGMLTEPDRDRLLRLDSAYELIRVTPRSGEPIVMWIERAAVETLQQWAAARVSALFPNEPKAETASAPVPGEPRVVGEYLRQDGPHDGEVRWLPRLVDTRTGEVILDLWGGHFYGPVESPRPGAVRMTLRNSFDTMYLEVDLDARVIRILADEVKAEYSREFFERALFASDYPSVSVEGGEGGDPAIDADLRSWAAVPRPGVILRDPQLDVDTGVLTVVETNGARQPLDPSRPMSTYVEWLRKVGAERGGEGASVVYTVRAGLWFVRLTFSMGLLRRVSLVMSYSGPAKELVTFHERWMREQVGEPTHVERSWGSVDSGWDKHFSAAEITILWRPVPVAGPPPEAGDLDRIRKATVLVTGPVGDEWELREPYLAYERLLAHPPPHDVLEEIVRVEATEAARAYATALLRMHHLDGG